MCMCVCKKCTYVSPLDRCLKVELLGKRMCFWNVGGGAQLWFQKPVRTHSSEWLRPLVSLPIMGCCWSVFILPVWWAKNWLCLLFYCQFDHWWNLLLFIFLLTDFFFYFVNYLVVVLPAFPFSCLYLLILYIYRYSEYIWNVNPLFSIYAVNIVPWFVLGVFDYGVFHTKAVVNFYAPDWFNLFFMVSVIRAMCRKVLFISIS